MRVRVLADHEIHLAQSLCYEVYVLEQSWVIHPNNPSQLKVEAGKLCDVYDAVAIWFGVFQDEYLIACHRVCSRLDGLFELERYYDLPEFIQQSDSAMEGNRLAVRKEYRSSAAIFKLTYFEFTYLLSQGVKFLFTTGFFPKPGNFYIRRLGLIKHGTPFKYYKDDQQQVYLFYADNSRMRETANKLQKIDAREQ